MANEANTKYFFYGEEGELNRFRENFLLKSEEVQEKSGLIIGWSLNDDNETFPLVSKKIKGKTVKGIFAEYGSKWNSEYESVQTWLLKNNYKIDFKYLDYSCESEFCWTNDYDKEIFNYDYYVLSIDCLDDFFNSSDFLTAEELKKKLQQALESKTDDLKALIKEAYAYAKERDLDFNCIKINGDETENNEEENLDKSFYEIHSDGSKELIVPEGVENIIFADDDKNRKLLNNVKKIILPSSIKDIPQETFYGLNIEAIELNCKIKKISKELFFNCRNLNRIKIPEGVELIGNSAFAGCSSLEEIILPSTLKEICDNAFENCSSLQKINIEACLKLKKIGKEAFRNCSSLMEIKLPAGIKKLSDRIFKNCTNLENVILPPTVEKIGNNAFEHCKIKGFKFKDFEIKNGLYISADSVVCTDMNIQEAIIPEGVKSIPDDCFKGCNKLKNVIIPDSVEAIGKNAFKNCRITNDIFKLNSTLEIRDGFLIEKKDSKITLVYNTDDSRKEIVVPDYISFIKDEAFSESKTLEKISFANSSVEFELKEWDGIFNNCSSLKEIILPESMKEIPEKFCINCSSLEKIVFPENVKKIGNQAFKNCFALSKIQFSNKTEEIKFNAFDGCISLKEIQLPSELKLLDERAFWKCSNLTSVKFPEHKLSINELAFEDCENLDEKTLNILKNCCE